MQLILSIEKFMNFFAVAAWSKILFPVFRYVRTLGRLWLN